MYKKILVGSRYFFSRIPGFTSKDSDYVKVVGSGEGFNYIRQITLTSTCYFEIVHRPKEELLQYALEHGPAMACGKFLVPEFCKEFNINLEDLKVLEPRFSEMDEKHTYEKIIFDAYMENGSMTLTEDQRNKAYESYKNTRKEE